MMLVLTTLIFSFSASIAYAQSGCSVSDPLDALKAFKDGAGTFLLQKSTDPQARDCLKGTPNGNRDGNTLPVTMTYKDDSKWVSLNWMFTLEGANIVATLEGKRKQRGELVYDVQSHDCHITKLSSGVYQQWQSNGSADDKDIKCCDEKFKELTSGIDYTKPQEKGCETSAK
uniref:Moubatin n=1 Tax=Ornithodoros moubata TaxID=6938 RepID=MOUB_ORNMO|nr:RecName: Full=Moubatin; AltName: Full=Lipocalin; AltName: Full=Platelet aggregation inhibitor; Short=PAI; Flags: Precursor [Ornithodoros moubata]AAA29432.1 moubatin [Ornithodoros moubata]